MMAPANGIRPSKTIHPLLLLSWSRRTVKARDGTIVAKPHMPLPARKECINLVKLYAREIPFSSDAVEDAASRTEGTTASFARELVRRAVVAAAMEDVAVDDRHLGSAVDGLMDDSEVLTRSLLGSGESGEFENRHMRNFGAAGMCGAGGLRTEHQRGRIPQARHSTCIAGLRAIPVGTRGLFPPTRL